MSVRANAGAGSAAGFVLGALGGAMFGNAGAEYARASKKGHDRAMMVGAVIGSFVGAVSLAAAAAGSADPEPQLQVRFP